MRWHRLATVLRRDVATSSPVSIIERFPFIEDKIIFYHAECDKDERLKGKNERDPSAQTSFSQEETKHRRTTR